MWFARAGKALSGQVSPPGPGQDLRWVSLEGCRSAPLHLAAQGARRWLRRFRQWRWDIGLGRGCVGHGADFQGVHLIRSRSRWVRSMAEQVSPPALRLCRMSSPSVEAGAFVPDLGLATPSSLHFLLRCPGTAAFGPVRRLLRGRYWSGKVLCDGSCCSGSGLKVSFPQPHPDPADQTGTLTRIRPGFLIVRH